jgi:hypothetical protein
MNRLDDIQKLRGLVDVERRCFKKETFNVTLFKTEVDEFFNKLEQKENLRITKEFTNLSLLSKIDMNSSPKTKLSTAFKSTNNEENVNSYF